MFARLFQRPKAEHSDTAEGRGQVKGQRQPTRWQTQDEQISIRAPRKEGSKVQHTSTLPISGWVGKTSGLGRVCCGSAAIKSFSSG